MIVRRVMYHTQLRNTSYSLCVPLCIYSSGCGRTGTFIAVSILLERLKTEGVVDVFSTVRSLRLQRPNMVQTVVSRGLIAACMTYNQPHYITISCSCFSRSSMNTVIRLFWSISTHLNFMQISSSYNSLYFNKIVLYRWIRVNSCVV